MGIKEQFGKMKENWLLILIVLILGVFLFGRGGSIGSNYAPSRMYAESADMAYNDGGFAKSAAYYPSPSNENFAPEVQERMITKTASLSTEVERGTFADNEARLKSIISSSDSYLLNENSNLYGRGKRSYHRGSYSIKVETGKYGAVISQLKAIGEVQSFNENSADITGGYVDTQDRLDAEESRLDRFNKMLDEATDVKDKIEITDRIFDIERTISYYKKSLANTEQRVSYSTISFSMSEKQSDYANVVWVKFSELIRSMVNSFNNLLHFVFVILPWAVAAGIIWGIYRLFKRKRQ